MLVKSLGTEPVNFRNFDHTFGTNPEPHTLIQVRRLEAEAKSREEVVKELRDALRHAKEREAEAVGRATRAEEAKEGGQGGDGRGLRAVVEMESKLKTAEEQIKVLSPEPSTL